MRSVPEWLGLPQGGGGGLQLSSRHEPLRRGRGGAGPEGWGGFKKNFSFWWHFSIPRFILTILNVHKWG